MSLPARPAFRRAVLAVALATIGASCDRGGVASSPAASTPPAPAASTPAAPLAGVTPKTQTPDVAKSLSSAFANTAKALRPSG